MSDERNPSLDTLSVPNLLRQLADAMEKENSFAVLLGPQPDERSQRRFIAARERVDEILLEVKRRSFALVLS